MDASAPLPSLADQAPRLGGGVLTRGVVGPGQSRRQTRGARDRLMEVVSHAALARLHPTSHHPESPRRLEVLLDAVGEWRDCGPATVEQIERCHTPEHVARIRAIDGRDVARRRHARLGDELRGGAARRGRRDRGRRARRLRARPASRPSRARRPRDGLLPLQQRRDRGPVRRRPSTGSSASRSSTGTSTTATGRRTSSGTTRASSTCRSTSGRSTRAPAGPERADRDDRQRPAAGGLGRRGVPPRVRGDRRAGGSSASSPTC